MVVKSRNVLVERLGLRVASGSSLRRGCDRQSDTRCAWRRVHTSEPDSLPATPQQESRQSEECHIATFPPGKVHVKFRIMSVPAELEGSAHHIKQQRCHVSHYYLTP